MDSWVRITLSVWGEVRDAGGLYNIYHWTELFSYIFSLLMLWPDIGFSLKPLVMLSFLAVTLICCAHNIVNKDPFTRSFNLQLMKKNVKISLDYVSGLFILGLEFMLERIGFVLSANEFV